MSGIGSLITFQGLTQGVLTTAARTIQSALDIEKAAAEAKLTALGLTADDLKALGLGGN